MSIPSVYHCEDCKHTALEAEFKGKGGHACPKCKSEDVFPTRWFKCGQCGHEAEQGYFFGVDIPKDDDPLEWDDPICPNELCDSKDDDEEWNENAPTQVTEIPVPGFAT